jgi:hypothetical protein
MILSVAEQATLMRRHWPEFPVVLETGWLIIWEGQLRPFHQSYRVRVFFCLGCELEAAEIVPAPPRVTVLDPALERRQETPDEPIPHHYSNEADPQRPILCLYDPREREWRLADAIAETAIPWTIDWLACYEGWRATGEWTGGGRHATLEEITPCPTPEPTRPNDRAARSSAAAFHSLGQRIGTFASLPLMAAASEGSTRPLSWRDWSSASWEAPPWRRTSTLLPVRQPGASSPWDLALDSIARTSLTSISGAGAKSSRPSEMGSSAQRSAA